MKVIALAVVPVASVVSLSARPAHWLDFLKFNGRPSFDVVERSVEYSKMRPVPTDLFADDFVFRGASVGPMSHEDVARTQRAFNLDGAYPDLDRECFGYSIDPQNPYRCLYFERWTGTNLGPLDLGFTTVAPTGQRVELPLFVTSINWNPEGKIVYSTVSPAVDRFEGTSKGATAVFGLLASAGAPLPAGGARLQFAQRANQFLALSPGKSWSNPNDIPAWWKSKALGEDPNDV